jgi:hypothetical protein
VSWPPGSLIIVLAIIAVLSAAALWVATPWGLGLSPDSAVYIGTARSLLLGAGFSLPSEPGAFAPIVHYPPLYPAVLAAIGFTGWDPLLAARWFNALLFAVNIYFMGWLAFTGTKSVLLSLSASALLASGFPIVQAHSMAWSEPLFIALELVGALFLTCYLRTSTSRILFAAAAAAGLSAVTRYAGTTFIASGIFSILFLNTEPGKKRLLHAGIFLAISSLPIGLWMARNWILTGTTADRIVSFHPVGIRHLVDLVTTIGGWVSGSSLLSVDERMAISVGVIAVGALMFWKYRQAGRAEPAETTDSVAFPGLMLSIIVAYILMLFATISFLDHQTPIDSRMLAPLYVLLVLLGVALEARLIGQRMNGIMFSAVVLLMTVILLTLQLASTWPWMALTHENGIGYASREWRESDLIRRVGSEPLGKRIFSNAPDVLYTLLGRPADMVPRKINPDTRKPNEAYPVQIKAMKEQLKASQGLLVYFDRVQWRWYLPSPSELESAMALRLLVREKDGSIYQID